MYQTINHPFYSMKKSFFLNKVSLHVNVKTSKFMFFLRHIMP